MHCIGCESDIFQKPSKDRKNLGSRSTGDPEPHKLVLSAWTSLLTKQLSLQGISIHQTTITLDCPERMCKICFTQYGNYQKLITLLEGKLSVALQKLDYSLKESTVDRCGTPVTPCSSKYEATSAIKRRCSGFFPMMMAAASQPVTVSHFFLLMSFVCFSLKR